MNVYLPENAVEAVLGRAAEFRHALHAAPETALEEQETRNLLLEYLGEGFRYKEPLLGTDLIVEWPGRDDSVCIALRADMDALALEEETGRSWSSRNPGKMHACGHDGHMAILASAALMLKENKCLPPVTVRFVFQPGEEVVGAGRTLAARGAYSGARAAFALHGWPDVPLGSIAFREGIFFGASHHFSALFRGKGGHGAHPERSKNPLPVAAEALLKLNALGDSLDYRMGEVVSVCSLQGGRASNVIPEAARLMGTVRYREACRGEALEKEVRRIITEAAEKGGISADLDYDRAYEVPVVNHPSGCAALKRAAAGSHIAAPLTCGSSETGSPAAYSSHSDLRESVGCSLSFRPIPVIETTEIERGSEDFAYALELVPGALFKLGLGDVAPLHSPHFDFPDEALGFGIAMMGRLAMNGGSS